MGDTSGFSKKELKLLERLNKEAMKMIEEEKKAKTVKKK
jgi:hypothetical protein